MINKNLKNLAAFGARPTTIHISLTVDQSGLEQHILKYTITLLSQPCPVVEGEGMRMSLPN